MIVFRKFKILCNVIHGYLFKWLVDLHVFKVPKLNGSIPLVVSLTSYGRRVKSEVVYYTSVFILLVLFFGWQLMNGIMLHCQSG